MKLTDEQTALLDAVIRLSSHEEARLLRSVRAGNVHTSDLPRALRQAAETIVGRRGRPTPQSLRPVGAPMITDEDRAEVRRLAESAGVVLT